MKRILSKILYTLGALFIAYVIVCSIDVVCHNTSDYKYSKWNVFAFLFKEENPEEAEVDTTTIVLEATTESTTELISTTELTTVTTTECTTETTTAYIETVVEDTEYVVLDEYTEDVKLATEEEVTYYSDEVEMLAHLINGEAGSDWCSDTLMYYVGSVVLNRMNHPDFPDSLSGVIYQDGQYSCTWDGNYDRTPSDRCYRIAEDLLVNGSVLPSDVVFQAPFEQGSGVYEIVQDMYFCYR